MSVGAGVALIVTGSTLGIVAALWLWRRVATAIAFGAAGASGAIVGTGALLVQDEASAAEWVLTLVALAVLTPVHARVVFGPPGRAR